MSLFDGVEDRYFLVYDFAYVAEFKNVRIEDATFLGPVGSAWIALQLTLVDQFHQNNRRGVLFLFTSLKKISWSSDKPALSQGLQRPSIEGREAAKIPMAWVYPVPRLLVCLVTPLPTPPLLYCHQLVCSVLLGDGDSSPLDARCFSAWDNKRGQFWHHFNPTTSELWDITAAGSHDRSPVIKVTQTWLVGALGVNLICTSKWKV